MNAVSTPIAGIRVLVAPNAGPFTHDGTNTYLLDTPEGVIVIDPGPLDETHVKAILTQAGGPIRYIVNTHTHHDHAGASRLLSKSADAPVLGHRLAAAEAYRPDIEIEDGDAIGPLTALFTPGHCTDHLCLSLNGKALFCGDTVLGWISTIIAPPTGDMSDYIRSLRRLLDRTEPIYFPGHGPAITAPHERVKELLARRLHRETTIIDALRGNAMTLDALAANLYENKPELHASGRTIVHSHLLKLHKEGRATLDIDNIWRLIPD